jgi:hypothetical protein
MTRRKYALKSDQKQLMIYVKAVRYDSEPDEKNVI